MFSALLPFLRGIQRSSVDHLHKGPVMGASMISVMSAWANCRINSQNCRWFESSWHPCDVAVMGIEFLIQYISTLVGVRMALRQLISYPVRRSDLDLYIDTNKPATITVTNIDDLIVTYIWHLVLTYTYFIDIIDTQQLPRKTNIKTTTTQCRDKWNGKTCWIPHIFIYLDDTERTISEDKKQLILCNVDIDYHSWIPVANFTNMD